MYDPNDWYITDEDVEKARVNGVSKERLRYRVQNQGWSKQKAIETPLNKRRKFSEYWIQIAEKNGIARKTFATRVRVYGYSEEEAATSPLIDRKKQAAEMREKARKFPKELLELAKRNGIRPALFYDRIHRRWDPQTAATTPFGQKKIVPTA